MKNFACLLFLAALAAAGAAAQDDSSGNAPPPENPWKEIQQKGLTAPLQSSNVLNPNVSLVATFVGAAGDDPNGPEADTEPFDLSEAELALQAAVDPYAKANVFIAFHDEESDLEEAYVTWLKLPKGLQLKAGKFLAGLGKLNQIHAPETPFADRPLAAEIFLGEEGLHSTGVGLTYLFPTPFYLQGTAEVSNIWPEAPAFGEEDPATGEIEKGGHRDLGWLGRLETFFDLNDASNLMLGLSYARGVHDPEEGRLSAQLWNADVTYRWKRPARAIYRSLLWRTEALWSRREMPAPMSGVTSWGGFSYLDWQFKRRWHAGARYDYSQFPDDDSLHERGWLGFLTFTPSEFSLLSLQGRSVRRADGHTDHTVFLKIQFNIGPHGAHPF